MKDTETNNLHKAITSITERLAIIESKLNIESVTTEQKEATTPKKTYNYSSKLRNKTASNLVATKKTSIFKESQPQGGRLLGYIGILFFVLAASFFIKLAIDSGWLTPARQFAGTILFGLALIRAGFIFKGKDPEYSSFLPSAGIIILFMASYAGHLYYELYGIFFAVVLTGAISLFSLHIFKYFNHDFFLISAVTGTYLVPILIGSFKSHPFQTCTYFLFWDLLYCSLAIILKRRLMIAVTAYLALAVFQTILGFHSHNNSELIWSICFQASQFLILSLGVVFYSIKNRSNLTATEAWGFFLTLLFFYSIEYSMIEEIAPSLAPWISIIFAVFIYTIYAVTKAKLGNIALNSSPMITTFLAIALFHSIYIELIPQGFGPWLAIILLMGVKEIKKLGLSYEKFWPCYFIIYAVIGFEYLHILNFKNPDKHFEFLILNLIVFAFLFIGQARKKSNESRSVLLIAAKLQALVALYRLADLIADKPIKLYLTSGFWAALALTLLVLSHKTRDTYLARSSVVIFGIVALKVLTVDLSASGSVAKIVALVLIGATLYAGGLILRQVNQWDQS